MPGWGAALDALMMPELTASVGAAYGARTCHPDPSKVFRALSAVGTPDRVRVVILGQDPYHGEGQADGLAFSVQQGQPLPPSLRNIFKEIVQTCGGIPPVHGDLSQWAEQGVLLLNDVLTVEQGMPRSHRDLGWQDVCTGILAQLNKRPVAFLLWGNHARQRAASVQALHKEHLVLEAPHPSPLSAHRGFLGCGHFQKVNAWLESRGEDPISWWPAWPEQYHGAG